MVKKIKIKIKKNSALLPSVDLKVSLMHKETQRTYRPGLVVLRPRKST